MKFNDKIEIVSHNQVGGITANQINISNGKKIEEKKKGIWANNWFKYLIIPLIVAIIAGVILLNISDMKEKKEPQTPNIQVNSYNQQGGITANEVNFGPKSRHLTDKEGAAIETKLKSLSATGVVVSTITMSGEPFDYAYEIKVFLEDRGWNVVWRPSMTSTTGPMKGLFYYQDEQIAGVAPHGYVEVFVGSNPSD